MNAATPALLVVTGTTTLATLALLVLARRLARTLDLLDESASALAHATMQAHQHRNRPIALAPTKPASRHHDAA